MHQMTAAQFQKTVRLDPAWASKLTEPVEITDFCDMKGSDITHLSPLLHFTGKNEYGSSAYFTHCYSLKTAEGNFKGAVAFSFSDIEKIGDLSCGKDSYSNSANFFDCKSLKIAEGEFPGFVSFAFSSIKKIGDLSCGKNVYGMRLNVEDCPSLAKIPHTFHPNEVRAGPELIKKLEVDRFIQKKREEIVEIEL